MSDFPECDFFCTFAGRVSVFPSNCGSPDLFVSIARDCKCSESPVAKGAACLQSICAPQDFAALVDAEEARCPGVVPNNTVARRADASEATTIPLKPEVFLVETGGAVHVGCDGGVTSPFVLVPLALVLFVVVAAAGAYRRRRVAARINLDSTVFFEREDAEDVRVNVGEKGWVAAA